MKPKYFIQLDQFLLEKEIKKKKPIQNYTQKLEKEEERLNQIEEVAKRGVAFHNIKEEPQTPNGVN